MLLPGVSSSSRRSAHGALEALPFVCWRVVGVACWRAGASGECVGGQGAAAAGQQPRYVRLACVLSVFCQCDAVCSYLRRF